MTEVRTEFKVRLSGRERAELRRLANSHGVPMAVYARSLIVPQTRTAAVNDDDWWHSQGPARKASIRRWLDETTRHPEGPIPGQLDLGDADDHDVAV